MATYVCKQCGAKFSYCPLCELRPAKYKDLGFCSKQCYDESKKEVVPTEDVEVVVIEEDTSTPTEKAIEYPYFFTEVKEDEITPTEEAKPRKKKVKPVEEIQKENITNENEQDYGSSI